MQRRTNIQVSSLVILLSIVTIILQFAIYYLFAAIYVIWGISCLVVIFSCHHLLEHSGTFEACFNYSLLNLFISLIIILLSYLGKGQSYLPYSGTMLGIAVINWLIPSLHCFLRYMIDYGAKVDDYNIFFRNDSILFLLFYFGILLFGSFSTTAFLWAYSSAAETANFIPFGIITARIEDYLYGYFSLKDILVYLTSRILTFLPYGYFITLLLRRQTRLVRLGALLVLPFLLEFLQFFIIPSRCDIDDLIYALLGGLLGTLSYCLVNFIFRLFTGRSFLTKVNASLYRSPLHF